MKGSLSGFGYWISNGYPDILDIFFSPSCGHAVGRLLH